MIHEFVNLNPLCLNNLKTKKIFWSSSGPNLNNKGFSFRRKWIADWALQCRGGGQQNHKSKMTYLQTWWTIVGQIFGDDEIRCKNSDCIIAWRIVEIVPCYSRWFFLIDQSPNVAAPAFEQKEIECRARIYSQQRQLCVNLLLIFIEHCPS